MAISLVSFVLNQAKFLKMYVFFAITISIYCDEFRFQIKAHWCTATRIDLLCSMYGVSTLSPGFWFISSSSTPVRELKTEKGPRTISMIYLRSVIRSMDDNVSLLNIPILRPRRYLTTKWLSTVDIDDF